MRVYQKFSTFGTPSFEFPKICGIKAADQMIACSTKFRMNSRDTTTMTGWISFASFLQIFTMQ